jgi:hypothetical protein
VSERYAAELLLEELPALDDLESDDLEPEVFESEDFASEDDEVDVDDFAAGADELLDEEPRLSLR